MFSAYAEKEKVGIYMYLCDVQGLEKLTTLPMIIRYIQMHKEAVTVAKVLQHDIP